MSKKTSFNNAKVLKKITLLFHLKGYVATSMQDIVDITGLNRSSIYNSFGSKLELFIKCFNLCETMYKRDIQKIILSNFPPLKSLHEIFELSIRKSFDKYLIPNYITEIKNEEPLIKQLILNQQAYMLDLFQDIVKRGQSIGTINNSKTNKQYASYLLTSYYGLQSMVNFSDEKIKLENIIYDIISVLE